MKKFINLDNVRLEDQRQVMEEIAHEGHCPFCSENLYRYHKQPILKEGKFWLLTKNQWPYDFTKLHLLAIYKTHANLINELDPGAGEELFELFKWAEKEFGVGGGGLGMRFGNVEYSGATVSHIHVQFMVPDADNPEAEPIRFKVGKSKKKN